MPPFLQPQIDFILFLQTLGAWLKPVMQFFTFLGEENFFIVVMPALYWTIDPGLGTRTQIIRRHLHPAVRTIRFIAAVIAAVIAVSLSPVKSSRRIWAAWKLLVCPKQRAPFWTVYRRYRACRHCPVFYPPLRTCGSPLDKDLRGLGCLCSMESKSGIKQATCWGDDNLGQDFKFGWISIL